MGVVNICVRQTHTHTPTNTNTNTELKAGCVCWETLSYQFYRSGASGACVGGLKIIRNNTKPQSHVRMLLDLIELIWSFPVGFPTPIPVEIGNECMNILLIYGAVGNMTIIQYMLIFLVYIIISGMLLSHYIF